MKTSRVRLSGKDRLNLFTDLSTMLSAGIPLLESLDSLRTESKGSVRKVLDALYGGTSDGQPLSHAMETLPRAFDPITVNLIRAAEAGGMLEETLTDLVQITKKEMAFSSSLKSTMIYPMFVAIIFSAIIILMLTFVVPRISKVFNSLRVELPATTKLMFKASDVFMANWLQIVVGIIVGIILISILVSYQKRAIIRIMLSLPGLRGLGRDIDLTRFTRSFALLMKSGVPLDDALLLSQRVVQKKQVVVVIEHMRTNITTGEPLSAGLRNSRRIIPPMMARSIETAEKSGTLEKTLQNLAEYFDEQVGQKLKGLSSMLEPVLIVIVGIMVGTLMITIMAPMYNLISQIQK